MRNSTAPVFRISILFLVIAFLTFGCGGDRRIKQDQSQYKVQFTQEEVPPGALPEVTAEQGGEGFTGEGWSSNSDYPSVADPRGTPGGKVTMGIVEFPSTFRTQGKDSNSELIRVIGDLVYEGLLGIHSITLEYYPVLATHWQVSEDKKTFRYRINPNARFSDGSRVTAEDVVATWKLRIDPGILAPYTNIIWGNFEEPVAESPYILSVTAKELNWKFFIYFSSMAIMPAKYLNQMTGSEYMTECQFRMLPGSGPYILDESSVIKGKTLAIKRRADYWDINNPKNKGSGNFDKIKFTAIQDERLRFEKFKKGELDFYQVGRAQWWVEETDFENVKRGLVVKKKIYNDEPQGVSGLVFNMREEPFNDIRMRQAFTHLMNREKLIDQLFFNEYTFLDSYYPGGIYENPNNPKYRFDPDKAVKLLAECGWQERDEEGWLINGQGQRLDLDLMMTNKALERIFTVIQEDLQKVGIKLNLKQTTGATAFKMVNERKFKIYFMQWSGLFFPNPENDISSWTADPLNTNNLAGVKDDRIDELIKLYNIEFDFGKRIGYIQEIDAILMEIQPFALGWYGPFHRMLWWNKFGTPEFYFYRTNDWRSILSGWWYDEEQAAQLEAARKDETITFDNGPVESRYWEEYAKKHGETFQIMGM